MGKKSKQQQKKEEATEKPAEKPAQQPAAEEKPVQMVAQQEEEAPVENMEQRIVALKIIDLNKREIHLKMVQQELVLELREFLSEHIYTCFFTNYYLEYKGERLSDYSDLSAFDPESENVVFMRPMMYDEKTARLHIKRVGDILSKPCVLNSQQKGQDEDEQSISDIKEQAKTEKWEETKLQEKISEKQETLFKKFSERQESRQKKLYQNFIKLVEQDLKQQYILPNKPADSEFQGHQTDLVDLQSSKIEQQMNVKTEISQFTQCIESIQYSAFNPVPQSRALAGDLFYLTVKTIDAGERGITCCVNGFYVNDSVERTQFNPAPSKKKSVVTGLPYQGFSYTLVGCLHQISPSFGKNLEKYVNQILNTEPYFLTDPATPVYHWTQFEDKQGNNLANQHELSDVVTPLYGLDPKGIRDWNEEFQVVRSFPKDTVGQRAQRDRAIAKIYNDFLVAATEGAKAIINGNLTSLNPTEGKFQQVYVYNYIFFSFALDVVENFKDLSTLESNPSWTQANHDMTGLKSLQLLEIDGLCYLATSIVNYKGHRVIAQSIIPGILNNSDLSSLAEYGTVDEQKTIRSNPEFHEMMKQVCEKMHIQLNKLIDDEGKEVEVAGCVEIKGIRGTDKRCYIVDLQGMTPRDANYLGDQNHTALVRQELLILYQRYRTLEHAKSKMEPFEKEVDAERDAKIPKAEEGKELTDEQKKDVEKLNQEYSLKKIKQFEAFMKEPKSLVFNTNVFKKVSLAMTESEIKTEEDKVKDLSKYLKENAVTNLIKNMQKNEGVPTDSESLAEFIHQNGVNMRYIGHIAAEIKEKNLTQMKYLLEREVVIRAMKHILNKYIRECSSNEVMSSMISHLLNCLLAPKDFLKKMDDGVVSLDQKTLKDLADESVIAGVETAKDEKVHEQAAPMSKKEKKRQKKKQTQEEEAATIAEEKVAEKKHIGDLLFKSPFEDISQFSSESFFKEPSVYLGVCPTEEVDFASISPKKLYAEIKTIAEKRYSYTLLPKKQAKLRCLETPANKMSLLRDVCKAVGVVLRMKSSEQYKEMILENDTTKMKEAISKYHHKLKLMQKSKKKTALPPMGQTNILADQEIFQYENLPFCSEDIVDFFPKLKTLTVQNKDVSTLMQEAKAQQSTDQLEKAFETYSQAINILLQISGAMNSDVAGCISKMANIQFRMQDYLQAIELQTKSIIIQEKVLGYDSPTVAYSYSNLGLYYHTCQFYTKGFECMHRSLKILKVVCGDNHPDISAIYLNLGLMYQDLENFHAAIDCFMESLSRNIALYGESHIQIAQSYQAIAQAYSMQHDFRMALDYQEKSHEIIKKIMPEDSQYVKQSQLQLHEFIRQSVQQEKKKKMEMNSQGIGAGKRQIGQNKAKMTEEEKKEMQKWQRIEQYVKKLQHTPFPQGAGQQQGFYELLEKKAKEQAAQKAAAAAGEEKKEKAPETTTQPKK